MAAYQRASKNQRGSPGFLDGWNLAGLVLVVVPTIYALMVSMDATVTEAMYLHGILNVGAFGVLIASGIARQITLTVTYDQSKRQEYIKLHKQRHTFVNALAMVPAYAALLIGQRARNGSKLSTTNWVLAFCFAGLLVLNFFLWMLRKTQITTILAWTTGALSLASTTLLILDNPGPSVIHHYLGITTVFMYQFLILRFFVKYGYSSGYSTFKKTENLSDVTRGLLWILLVPVTYIGDLYKALTYKKETTKSNQRKPVLKYYDHIIWGFATLGVSLGAVFTGIALFSDWYGDADYVAILNIVLYTGLASFLVAFISIVTFRTFLIPK